MMSWYRRADRDGGTYFFTVVTYHRRPLFRDELARRCLHNAFEQVRQQRPFELEAICLLPEHLHCVWTLPEGDNEYSVRWGAVKSAFTFAYLKAGGREGKRSDSRKRSGDAAIWQRRFWEHLIRDQQDYSRHMDYIHYNPVKHGLVRRAADWPWSTFHRYVKEGVYDKDWASQGLDWIDDFGCAGE